MTGSGYLCVFREELCCNACNEQPSAQPSTLGKHNTLPMKRLRCRAWPAASMQALLGENTTAAYTTSVLNRYIILQI